MKTWPVYLFVIGLLILYILKLQYCTKQICKDTIVPKVDTQAIVNKYTSSWTKPKPDTIHKVRVVIKETPGEPPRPVFVETVTEVPKYIPLPVDTQTILQDYYATVVYKDSTISGKDTIRVTDHISRNRIQARQWNISKTTYKVTPGNPIQVYWEGGMYGSRAEFIHAAETSLGYINRRGQGLEFSILRNDDWRYGLKFHTTLFTIK